MMYLDAHPLAKAFVANKFDRLAAMIVDQGDELLRDAGIEFPSRAVSLFMLVGEDRQLSVADVAATLGQPHQLVTQRADILIDFGLIERSSDPADGRRKTLILTGKGEAQYAKLEFILSEAANAFDELFREIECDMPAFAMKAMDALGRATLLERINLQSASQRETVSNRQGYQA
jgi:DNA-binding MarR family transcriptional regulator